MKADVKKVWIGELRSGKRKQGQGNLKRSVDYANEPRYCCLGVLCEIAIEQGVQLNVETPNEAGFGDGRWTFDCEDEGLPDKVVDWAGIDSIGRWDDYNLRDYDGQMVEGLADLNDRGWTFEQLADIIEKEF